MRTPNLELERSLQQAGLERVAGVDEAGRGAWAGPVVAAAVMLPGDRPDLESLLEGVRDSKQLSPRSRAECAVRIRDIALSIGIGASSAQEVDRLGLMPATRAAMRRALLGLDRPPQHLLLDYMILPDLAFDQTALPRGDARVLSIAAASIIAKVSRDALMCEIGRVFPGYGFEQHKGYGTALHRLALSRLGPAPVHRFSYQPVARRRLDAPAHAVTDGR